MTVTLYLSCSLGLHNRRPRAHSAGCWLSLLHLISIFSGPQTPSGFPRAPSVGFGFPYHISLQLSGTLLVTTLARRTFLNYIIVRRPLDLWNRMFNRHQAEITVMQFRGHSLPVHQSMRCPWCNGYRHRIWTQRYEFNSWTRLIAFHIALIPLGKVWIQLFSLQLNSWTD